MRALLWDVDGTIAETERDGHRVAFNQAFESMGLPWRWDDAHYGRLLAVTGGRERLLHDMMTRGDAPSSPQRREALAAELHRRKNAAYADLVAAGAVAWRPGVRELMDACDTAQVRQAIVTTTGRGNADALFGVAFGPRWAQRFAAVLCGEDVRHKKPDPEVYRLALKQLGIGPHQALAIEDSPAGAAAARAAGVPLLVTPSVYFAGAAIDGAVAVGPGLHQRRGWRPAPHAGDGPITLDDLRRWHALGDRVSP